MLAHTDTDNKIQLTHIFRNMIYKPDTSAVNVFTYLLFSKQWFTDAGLWIDHVG